MDFQELVESCAKTTHEANRAFAALHGDQQPSWEDAPEEIRESSRKGVRKILANPAITPEEIHQEWVDEKAKDGWHYGPVKDTPMKTHPCMVAFAELPEHERFKDELFLAIAREAALNYLSQQAQRVARRFRGRRDP